MRLSVGGRSHQDVNLFQILLGPVADLGMRDRGRPIAQGRAGGNAAEFLRGQVHDPRVFHVSGGGDEHVVRCVMPAEVTKQDLAVEATHGLACTQDRPAQGVVAPITLSEDLVHQVVRGILHHLDFFADYL